MHLYEPTTAATDLILAVFTLVLGLRVHATRRGRRQLSMLLLECALFSVCIGATLAAVSHGPGRGFDPLVLAVVWKLSLIMVGLGVFLIMAGVFVAGVPRTWSRAIIALGIVKFIVYAIWIVTHDVGFDDYHVVLFDNGIAFAATLVLATIVAVRRKGKWAGWIFAAMVITFIAGAVQQSGIVVHPHFNYNDMYHIILLAAAYTTYRSALLIQDYYKP